MHRTVGKRIRWTSRLLFALSLAFAGSAPVALGRGGPFQAAQMRQSARRPDSNPMREVACGTLVAGSQGGIDRIVVKAELYQEAILSGEVDFIADWPKAPKTVQVFREPWGFADMFLDVAGNIVTEWVAGDRPVVEVFHVINGRAARVFSRGARAGFDFWRDTILVNNAALGADGNYRDTTTEIWRWNGAAYKLIATVSHGQRLEALARLMRDTDE